MLQLDMGEDNVIGAIALFIVYCDKMRLGETGKNSYLRHHLQRVYSRRISNSLLDKGWQTSPYRISPESRFPRDGSSAALPLSRYPPQDGTCRNLRC